MTWIWVGVGVIAYIFIGFVLNAFMSGYYDCVFEDSVDPIIIVFWPIVLGCYALFDVIGNIFDKVQTLGEKTRKRKDERK